MYKISNNFKKIDAISETFSAIILMVIAISIFIPLNMYIESDKGTSYTPSPLIVGHLEDDKIIIEHCQGPSLDLDAKCTVNIGGLSTVFGTMPVASITISTSVFDISPVRVFSASITRFLLSGISVIFATFPR